MSEEQGWWMIVTEMGIDTRTPMGKAMAHIAVVFAELERDFIRARSAARPRDSGTGCTEQLAQVPDERAADL
jgi:hypothetical protein